MNIDMSQIQKLKIPRFGIILLSFIFAIVFVKIANAELYGWIFPDFLFVNDFWMPTRSLSSVATANSDWIGLSFLAILVVTTIGAIGYILSAIFGPRVLAWSKNLISNCVKSLILLCLCSALFVAVNQMPTDSFGLAGFIQIDNAIDFAEGVRNTIIYEFSTLTLITAVMSMVGNITPYFRPAGIIGISFSLAPAFRPIFDTLGIMVSSLAVAVGVWFVQLWLLIFVKTRLLAVLMPLGLFLRSIGIFRAGNVLIAVAIGFYFVFPFVLNINAIALENYLVGNFEGTDAIYQNSQMQTFSTYHDCVQHTASGGGSHHCFFKLSIYGTWHYIEETVLNGQGAAISILLFAIMTPFTGSYLASTIFSIVAIYSLSLLGSILFYVIIVSVLVPLFNIFITLTVIKELAKYLGTEIDLSAFEKIF